MKDKEIVQLYWDRDEQAVRATSKKYGAYCQKIAMNILNDYGDAEECVNDTYVKVWNCIPPHKPERLATFLGKITRNLSFDVYKKKHTSKRGEGQVDVVLDELSEIISGGYEPENEIIKQELMNEINQFLAKLPQNKRQIFVCRYWYADSVTEIAKRFGMTENSVSVCLSRVRVDLKNYLVERGYFYD